MPEAEAKAGARAEAAAAYASFCHDASAVAMPGAQSAKAAAAWYTLAWAGGACLIRSG